MRFYIWFEDETFDKAIYSHNDNGYDSIKDAIKEANELLEDEEIELQFVIIDSKYKIVYSNKSKTKLAS